MKILKDSMIYLMGELFAKALPFLLLPYLTRKLGAAGFGELSFYQTILALLVLVLSLSQDGAVARYYYVYGKRNLHNLVYSGYLYTFSIAIMGLMIAWFFHSWVLAIVVCTAASQCVLSVQLTLRQCQKQALSYTLIQSSTGFLGALLTVLLLEYTHNHPIEWRFTAILMANVSISLGAFLWFYCQLSHRPQTNWRLLRLSAAYILAFGVPLLLHHASGFIKGQLDRMLLFSIYSNAELGVYAAGFQVASIFSVLLMAVNKATIPYYYQAMKTGALNGKKVRRWALWGLLCAPILAATTWLLPEQLFLWFLGAEYQGVHHYIGLFLLGFGLTIPYLLLVNHLFYFGKNSMIAKISMLSAVAYLCTLAVLAPLNIQYTPWAMIIGNLCILPLLFYQVRD